LTASSASCVAARAARIEVLYTLIESLTKDGRDRSLDHKLSDIHIPKGHPDARVIDDIAPVEDEIVLPKTSSGVFNSRPQLAPYGGGQRGPRGTRITRRSWRF
jgi:nicotinamidase-related amidase